MWAPFHLAPLVDREQLQVMSEWKLHPMCSDQCLQELLYGLLRMEFENGIAHLELQGIFVFSRFDE
jgi:hypothetical protein